MIWEKAYYSFFFSPEHSIIGPHLSTSKDEKLKGALLDQGSETQYTCMRVSPPYDASSSRKNCLSIGLHLPGRKKYYHGSSLRHIQSRQMTTLTTSTRNTFVSQTQMEQTGKRALTIVARLFILSFLLDFLITTVELANHRCWSRTRRREEWQVINVEEAIFFIFLLGEELCSIDDKMTLPKHKD